VKRASVELVRASFFSFAHSIARGIPPCLLSPLMSRLAVSWRTSAWKNPQHPRDHEAYLAERQRVVISEIAAARFAPLARTGISIPLQLDGALFVHVICHCCACFRSHWLPFRKKSASKSFPRDGLLARARTNQTDKAAIGSYRWPSKAVARRSSMLLFDEPICSVSKRLRVYRFFSTPTGIRTRLGPPKCISFDAEAKRVASSTA
jgi:hypothetical protein